MPASSPLPPAPSLTDRLHALRRPDKWYLSAGDGFIWAPAYPVWLHAPGFWDEAHIYYGPFAPLFSVALVDDHGREVPLTQTSRTWQPGRLVSRYAVALPTHLPAVTLVETKRLAPDGRFRSRWQVENAGGFDALRGYHLIAFTAQPGPDVPTAQIAAPGAIRWQRTLIDRREVPMVVQATLSAAAGALRDFPVSAVRSEGSAVQPHWRFTPFEERFNLPRADSASGSTPPPPLNTGLRPEVRLEGISSTGLVYAAVSVPLDRAAAAGARDILFQLRVELADPAHRIKSRFTPAQADDESFDPWPDYLASFPPFRCDDPFLTRYYDYRTYGLYLCRLEGGAGNVHHACIAEGIAYFHVPITYSGQCHMLEMRWADLSSARGTLLNFLDTQHDDGSFNGRIYTNHLKGTDFYHANWGDALLGVDAVAPDAEYLRTCTPRLAKYAHWLSTARDPDASGMCIVINHFETGQEYMSRYQAVNARADEDGWKDTTRLQAIDATVYVYLLHQALATIARRQNDPAAAARHDAGAQRSAAALMQRMWDPAVGMFSDIDPATGHRTGVKAAVCFYPMLTDLLTDQHVEALLAHLTNPAEFATNWPLPSSAVDDPAFNAEAEWKGKRHVCPWNGRLWPMTNSHVIDGLIRQWHRRDPAAGAASPRARCGPVAAHLLDRFVKVMFHKGDISRPNCFEHYNPFTGRACEYRGIDDYQHSWVNDLLIRALGGIEPVAADGWSAGRCVPHTQPGVFIDPLPAAVDHLVLSDVNIRGRRVSVTRELQRFRVTLDGKPAGESAIGTPLFIPLP